MLLNFFTRGSLSVAPIVNLDNASNAKRYTVLEYYVIMLSRHILKSLHITKIDYRFTGANSDYLYLSLSSFEVV